MILVDKFLTYLGNVVQLQSYFAEVFIEISDLLPQFLNICMLYEYVYVVKGDYNKAQSWWNREGAEYLSRCNGDFQARTGQSRR